MEPYLMLAAFGCFSAGTTVLYSFTKGKYRYIVLLLMSLLFAALISKTGIVFLLLTILSTYAAGMAMGKIGGRIDLKSLEKAERKEIKRKIKGKKKRIVALYIFFNLGILFLIKYDALFFGKPLTGFAKIGMPLGISYYTLQSMGYVLDVYRGKYMAERNPLKLALFISFFPQLHEGPIGRYDDLAPSLFKQEGIKQEDVFNGIAGILWGLFKIMVIANRAAMISDAVFKDFSAYSGYGVLIGGAAFTLQLYAEFSGYINIAGGISEILGIKLAKNFNLPFFAEGVADFWRRWHISLGSWFRDYLFYPLSTSKHETIWSSLFVVWLLTGIWHGASWKYAAYGLYYFILMAAGEYLKPKTDRLWEKAGIRTENRGLRAFRIVKTWLFVVIGMLLFRAESLSQFKQMMLHLFFKGKPLRLGEIMEPTELLVLMAGIFILILSVYLTKGKPQIARRYSGLSAYKKYLLCFCSFSFIMIFGAYGFEYMPPDPIYGGF